MHCLLFCWIVALHIPVLTHSQLKPTERRNTTAEQHSDFLDLSTVKSYKGVDLLDILNEASSKNSRKGSFGGLSQSLTKKTDHYGHTADQTQFHNNRANSPKQTFTSNYVFSNKTPSARFKPYSSHHTSRTEDKILTGIPKSESTLVVQKLLQVLRKSSQNELFAKPSSVSRSPVIFQKHRPPATVPALFHRLFFPWISARKRRPLHKPDKNNVPLDQIPTAKWNLKHTSNGASVNQNDDNALTHTGVSAKGTSASDVNGISFQAGKDARVVGRQAESSGLPTELLEMPTEALRGPAGSQGVLKKSLRVPAVALGVSSGSLGVPGWSLGVSTESPGVSAKSRGVPVESVAVPAEMQKVPVKSLGVAAHPQPHRQSFLSDQETSARNEDSNGTLIRNHIIAALSSMRQQDLPEVKLAKSEQRDEGRKGSAATRKRHRRRRETHNIFTDVLGLDATLDYIIDDFIGAHPQSRARGRRTIGRDDGIYGILKRRTVLERIAREDSSQLKDKKNENAAGVSAPYAIHSHSRLPREDERPGIQDLRINDKKRRDVEYLFGEGVAKQDYYEPVIGIEYLIHDLESGEVFHEDVKRHSPQDGLHDVIKRVLTKPVNYDARRDSPPGSQNTASFGPFHGLSVDRKSKRDYLASISTEKNNRPNTRHRFDVRHDSNTAAKLFSAQARTLAALTKNKNQLMARRMKKSSEEGTDILQTALLHASKSYKGKTLSRSKRLHGVNNLREHSPSAAPKTRKQKRQSRTRRKFQSDPRFRSPSKAVSNQISLDRLRLEPTFVDLTITVPSSLDRGDEIFDQIISDTMIRNEELTMDDKVPDLVGGSRKKRNQGSADTMTQKEELTTHDKLPDVRGTPMKRRSSGGAMRHKGKLNMADKLPRVNGVSRKKRQASSDAMVHREDLKMPDKLPSVNGASRKKREASGDAMVHKEELKMPDKLPIVNGTSMKQREASDDAMADKGELIMPDKVPIVNGASMKQREASGDAMADKGKLKMPDKVPSVNGASEKQREASGDVTAHTEELKLNGKVHEQMDGSTEKREASLGTQIHTEEEGADGGVHDVITSARKTRQALDGKYGWCIERTGKAKVGSLNCPSE